MKSHNAIQGNLQGNRINEPTNSKAMTSIEKYIKEKGYPSPSLPIAGPKQVFAHNAHRFKLPYVHAGYRRQGIGRESHYREKHYHNVSIFDGNKIVKWERDPERR
jgi:hypothetical protein